MSLFEWLIRLAVLLTALFWLCLLVSVVHASPVILPPVEYDHPFQGRLIVEVLPLSDTVQRCHDRGYPNSDACAWYFPDPLGPSRRACHVIYPSLKETGWRRFVWLIRHETAHCNGWPGWHPKGHYEGIV